MSKGRCRRYNVSHHRDNDDDGCCHGSILSHTTITTMTSTETPTTTGHPQGPHNTIRLVCAGLGRTGTLSLTQALTVLGYKPYHYIDFSHDREWAALAETKNEDTTRAVIDRILDDGYDAVLENPTCDIYTDILERFPDAKVVLTVRDSPQAFEKSWRILMDAMVITERPFSIGFPSFFQWIPLFRRLKALRAFLGTTHLSLERGALAHGWRDRPDGWLAEQYEKHNAHVKATVPPDKLLVLNVKEGWEPLCRFLGCPVPEDQEFPHSTTNTKESLIKLKRTFRWAVYGWIPVTVLAVVATTAAAGALGAGNRQIGSQTSDL